MKGKAMSLFKLQTTSRTRRTRLTLQRLDDRCLPSGVNVINLGAGSAYDLNNAGQVVGTMGVLNWQTGTTLEISGMGVNDAGQVAGGSTQAFVWDPSTGSTYLGHLPGDTTSYANDLNMAGQVVGASEFGATGAYAGTFSNAADNSHAFVWDAINGMQSLGPFPNRNFSTATCINEAGDVVGYAQTSYSNGAYQ
jgi:uncharacterized membrane protein